jgi:cytochrome P450
MRRAQAEVRQIVPSGADMPMEALDELVYVEACINETMRPKPVATFLPSQAIRDTVIDGIEVSADTLVLGLIRPDATDSRYFPEPMKFDPDRWLAQKAGSANAKSTTRVSMPFGAGSRLCPGRYLTLLEMKLAMAMLLRTFSIDRVGTADGKPTRELFAFAMGPVGLRMRLTEATTA